MIWDAAVHWIRSGLKGIAVLVAVMLLVGNLGFFGLPSAQAKVLAQTDTCTMPYESVSLPLTQLAGKTYIRMDGVNTGFKGGLYPNGSNTRPPAHEAAGVAIAQTIQPLDSNGDPDPANGRIGMISIGMSNTGQEFGAFQKLLHKNPTINPRLVTVNGGVGGRTADFWVDPSSDAWQELARRLERASITQEQIQVVWINLTLTKGGNFPDKAIQLQTDLGEILRLLKARFPNLKLAYLSSRARSYTYWRGLSPEPLAFETGFAVKWLIEQQIDGAPELNFDPAKGKVRAPYLSWGPYFWVNGPEPRADGFSWGPEDLAGDCTHPSLQGRAKIGGLLLDFFLNDSTTRPWFRYGFQTQAVSPTSVPASSTPSPSLEPLKVGTQSTASPTPRSIPTPIPGSVPKSAPTGLPIVNLIAYGTIGLVLFGLAYVVLRQRNSTR